MSSDEDHLCRKDGAERWAEKMLVSSCDILREIGTWKTEKGAGDEELRSQNRKGVAEVFSEKSVKRTRRRGKLRKEVGCGAALLAFGSPAGSAPSPGATTCGAWAAA